MELQVEHLFVFFSITHFARKNKRGRKKFWIRELYEKGTGDSGSRIRFPDEIFQTGDQDLQRGGNRRESEGSKAGFQLQNTEAPKMFRKGLPGEGERKKENGNRRKRYGD